MRAHPPRFIALALLLLAAPSVAWAKSAVVSPFVGKSGVDSLQVLNITSLVASEVDFSMSFDSVHQLEAMPQGMNVNCLANPTCLAGVAKAGGADVVIAGSVAKVGEEFEIFMVNYDRSGGIVRKKSWRVPSDPTRMADRMSSLVAELLTGKSTEQSQKEDDFSTLTDISTSDLMDDEEEFEFESADLQVGRRVVTPELSDRDLDDFERLDAEEDGREGELAAQREREAQAKAAAEAERKRQEEEARARAEAERRRQEEEARAAAEAERRRQEQARARAAAVDDDDEEEFTFAPVSAEDMGFDIAPAGDLIVEEEDDYGYDSMGRGSSGGSGTYVVDRDVDFDEFDSLDDRGGSGARRGSSIDDLEEEESMSARVKREEQERKQREAEEKAREREKSRGYADLEEDDYRDRREPVGRISGGSNERQKVSLAARFGTSGFQNLQFLTYGGEIAFPVGDSARIETGLEAFSVHRQYDVETGLCDTTEVDGQQVLGCYRWNTILPFHVGARYQKSDRKARPYIGGDLTLTPYTEDFKLAFGFRGRGGVDFLPTKVFGLNLNLSAGMMHGSQFEFVQQDMSNTALVWQVSAGTVLML
ncbi:MAG: hypothetical protein ABIO70_36240 [Pseudomonadota bacterium]